jgi:hypothetical protein
VFDKSIITRDIKEIDHNALVIVMVPNKDADDQTQVKVKKFKWKCLKFEKNLMQIQIIFDTPSYVSYEGYDIITVQVRDHKMFQVLESN